MTADFTLKPEYIACRDCDLLYPIKEINFGHTARCDRCGSVLLQKKENSIIRTLALTIAGLILFVIANVYPILTLKVIGATTTNTLIIGVIALFESGLKISAILVFLTSILLPFFKLLALLYVLLPITMNYRLPGMAWVFRMYDVIDNWGMLEVYMLTTVIAIVKLADIAEVSMNLGLYAFIGLFFLTFSASVVLDSRIVWDKLEKGI